MVLGAFSTKLRIDILTRDESSKLVPLPRHFVTRHPSPVTRHPSPTEVNALWWRSEVASFVGWREMALDPLVFSITGGTIV